MMRVRNAQFRIRSRAHLARHDERRDASEVGLECQHLQVEHHPDVILVAVRDACRFLEHRQLAGALLLRLLDAALEVPDGVDILRQLRAVPGAEACLQFRDVLEECVEDALVLLESTTPGFDAGVLRVAEHPFEHRARVDLDRQRRRLRSPRQGVAVRAAVARVARTEEVTRITAELERRELRLRSHVLRHDLIHRDACPDIGTLGFLRMHTGQVARGRACVVPGAFSGQRICRLVHQSAQHEQVIVERRQRRQRRRQVESGAFDGRRPPVHDDAVRDVDGRQSWRRAGGRCPDWAERRHHGVEERQRHRGAEPPKHRAPRHSLFRALRRFEYTHQRFLE